MQEKRSYVIFIGVFYYINRPKEEMLFIYGGERSLPEKIWSEDMTSSRELKVINSSTHNPAIVYNLLGGQLSNAEPVFIYYTFLKSKNITCIACAGISIMIYVAKSLVQVAFNQTLNYSEGL